MNNETPKVAAIVVTYNRLNLLKECINALQAQTYNLHKIIIVNNKSTDGTTEYITQEFGKNGLFSILNLEKNIGGSGGFYEGIKEGAKLGSDWLWLMDDDTIPTPDSLKKLIEKKDIVPNTGFLGSSVLFTDGTPHKMNNTTPKRNEVLKIEWNAYAKKNLLTVLYVSFVSALISIDAVKKAGLPYKEFFIWEDDREYTQRIINAGYFGGLVLDSIVYHKTKDNYAVDISSADDSLAWKYFYGMRNSVFVEKKKRGKLNFILWYIYQGYKINKKLKKITGNKKLKKSIKKGRRKGLFFNPKIDFI